MEKRDSNLDGLYQDLADRFRALSQLFGQMDSPERAQALLDSLISEDAAAFSRLIDRVHIPVPEKCFWVQRVIERIVSTPAGFVDECWLRDDLTSQERELYLQIAFRHRSRQAPPVGEGGPLSPNTETVIPAGPFLDELRANRLVTCKRRQAYDSGIALGLSEPEQICVRDRA